MAASPVVVGGSADATFRCVSCRIDVLGERGREGVESRPEAGVVGAGIAGVPQIPPENVPGSSPVFLHFRGLGGFDGAGSEAGLAGGEAGPDVDGRDLALAVSAFGAGHERAAGGQLWPDVLADAPGLQCLAPPLVVDQGRAGVVELAGEGLEPGLETERVGQLTGQGAGEARW